MVLYSQNVRSVFKNFDKLLVELKDISVDVLMIQETWRVRGSYHIAGFHAPEYKTRIKSKRGGGVMTWVSNRLNYSIEEDLSPFIMGHIESVAVKIEANHKSLVVLNVYRPPSGDINIFEEEITRTVGECQDRQLKLIIAGDINIDFGSGSGDATRLQNMLDSLSLEQWVKSPTRVTANTKTLIDHVYAQPDLNVTCRTNHSLVSDHEAITIKCKINIKGVNRITKRDAKLIYTKENLLQLNNDLIGFSHDANFLAQDINCKIDTVQTHIHLYINKYCRVKIKPRQEVIPWFTKNLKKMKSEVLKLKKKYLRNVMDLGCKYNYNQKKKEFDAEVNKAKQAYYSTKLKTSNPKKLWAAIKEASGTEKRPQPKPTQLKMTNGSKIRCTKAEAFNNYFSGVAKDMVSKLRTTATNAHIGKPPSDKVGNFSFRTISAKTLEGIIGGLNTKNSTGKFGISNSLIKALKTGLSQVMTHIVNESIATNTFPEIWKEARVIPLYKKGDKEKISNYRPISLLPTLSKVLEKVMVWQITDYFEKRNLFPEKQYGFRKHRSTSQAVMDLVSKLEHLNSKKIKYSLLFMDFSKAFDLIDHRILRERLHNYGFQDSAVRLLSGYLKERRQYVEYEGVVSESVKLGEIGCPQGSCLGPLLYIIYTSDMAQLKVLGDMFYFADDTCMIIEANKGENLATKTEEQVSVVTDWINANKLFLNEGKTVCYMMGGGLTPDDRIRIGSEKVKVAPKNQASKYLGVWLTPELKWGHQLDQTISKLSKGLGAIQLGAKTLDQRNLKLVYSAFFECHLQYAAEVWQPSLTQKQQNKLESLQKKAIRRINGKKRNSHTETLFNNSRILKLKDRVSLQCCKTMMLSWVDQNKTWNTNDAYKWKIRCPESIASSFKINKVNTRKTYQLRMNPQTRTKRQQEYVRTFEKYRWKITDNTIKIQTRIREIKNEMVDNYTNNCNKDDCYVCRT